MVGEPGLEAMLCQGSSPGLLPPGEMVAEGLGGLTCLAQAASCPSLRGLAASAWLVYLPCIPPLGGSWWEWLVPSLWELLTG